MFEPPKTDDWDSWLVHADVLTERGDPRGELLVLEHRGGVDRARALAAADDWMTAWAEQLGTDDLETYLWIRSLAPLAEPPTPLELLSVFARPISQLLAQLDLEAPSPPDIAPVFVQHRERVIAATLAWIDRAFDGVPVPDENHHTIRQAEAADNFESCDRSQDHLGRWQELPDEHVLGNPWALPHLDAHGIHYYVPAVMSFALRCRANPELPNNWITESLEYTLQPDDGNLRDYQHKRFERFDRAQRRAIYAFVLVMEQVPASIAWGRVWEAECDGTREDWFAVFAPVSSGA